MPPSSNTVLHQSDSNEEPQGTNAMEQDPDSALESFIVDHPRPAVGLRTPSLPRPIVIPQRRPGNKERGFVEAYAPDLQSFGIDEEAFLAFIQATNKAVQASKWLYAIQVAAMGTGFIPNHIALGASAAVQIVAGIVAKTETRWNPQAGISYGQESLPDSVATLVYPAAPHATPEAATKKKVFARLNDYFDRRAQARYAAESKGDVLSSPPQKPFSNRYLDPNHPASNGGLLGLLSGGKLTPDREKQVESMRSAMAEQEQAIRDQQALQMSNLGSVLQGMGLTPEQKRSYIEQYESAYELQLQQLQQQSELLEHRQRRINRNILYLMVVNMPSGEELDAARRQKPGQSSEQIGSGVLIESVNVE
ncbi:hypothetical protein FMEXI_10344 [Fusarium mexicanum]|uniref:Uncharacterized protein n=1 Tax=Fusarium mexicanum TaxID=751941 RepID=A0A8H5IFN1_9HYPO|nr:hypothetical protein FMEXI_10344 [Fusarium mexicanum]